MGEAERPMLGDFNGQVIQRILRAYDLGELRNVRRHTGTAGRTWKLETSAGIWLVRTRGVRTSSEQALSFDHGLRRHLVQHGIPTAAPVLARDRQSFVHLGGSTYEVYPFVSGQPVEQASAEALAHAARALARFHQVAATYDQARTAPPLAQYATIGMDQPSDRMEDPELLNLIYERLAADPRTRDFEDAIQVCRRWLQRLRTEFDQPTYDALPHTVTHGDYTLANLLFDDEDRVVGIFDLDWARWGPRVRDLADGMYFIGSLRQTALRPGDIWSLTEAAQFELQRCLTWLRAYDEVAALSPAEIEAVPLAFAARWLSVRVEGMAKVAPQERLRFCFRDITKPLQWLEAHWAELCMTLGI